ncbi:MAG: polysaccharide deacetylase family protein [Bacillota bacterium]|nr:polysaccharide deacetylase family protein [Bacillota bacterium]
MRRHGEGWSPRGRLRPRTGAGGLFFVFVGRRALVAALALLLAAAYGLRWAGGLASGAGARAERPVPEHEEVIAPAPGASPPQLPIFYARTTRRVAGLTFDISWGSKVAPLVLDVLQQHHVHATFFLSGFWARQHPDLVRRMVAEGHEIASHGDEHVDLDRLSREQVRENLLTAQRDIRSVVDVRPRFLRPPNGAYSGMVVETAHQLGYETVIWSVDSLDWKRPGPEAIVRRVTSLVFPGAILLFHASDSAPDTPVALPAVLATLKARGYRAVPLGELFKEAPPARDDPRGRPDYPPNDEPGPSGSGAG